MASVDHWGLGACTLIGDDDDDHWGTVLDVRGLFAARDSGDRREIQLLGCDPRGKLRKGLGSQRAGGFEAGNAHLDILDRDGIAMGSYFLSGLTVTTVRTSQLGPGLVDLAGMVWCDLALPGSGRIWNRIRVGELNRLGMWRDLDTDGRRAWLSVALLSNSYRRRGRPDSAAGQVFTMDPTGIADIDGFYCALGEAVNGPGGYFGWNLDALEDCLRGGWGAANPFTLRWPRSESARASLAVPLAEGSGQTVLDVLLEIFRDNRIELLFG
nr:barstar family protein [Nocardia yamanashiensis]